MNTDYSIAILAEQRRQEFAAEAANDHLAHLVTADRPSWWLRLGRSLLPKPTPTFTAGHRVA